MRTTVPRHLLRIAVVSSWLIAAGCSETTTGDNADIEHLNVVAAPGSAESHLATAPDGTVVMSWLESDGERVLLRYSTLRDDVWSEPTTVAGGDDWFVNWADFPSVVPLTDDLWAAHWLVKQPGGTYSYDVAVSVSTNGGKAWSAPVTPHDDGTPTEHGFVSLFPHKAGVGALWLDGRNMLGEHGAGGGMTLRSAVITPDGEVTEARLADELVCDCCQTDVAIGPDGPIAVYRDRSREEIRDVYISHFTGDSWQAGRPVADDGWEIAGCPVNGPAIAARGDDVAVAWFTAANDEPLVRFARSRDGGASFAPPVNLEPQGAIGRVAVLLLDNGDALASWLADEGNDNAALMIGHVGYSGAVGKQMAITTTGSSRLSGFPQMVRTGNTIVVSWTDTSGDTTQVRSLSMDSAWWLAN